MQKLSDGLQLCATIHSKRFLGSRISSDLKYCRLHKLGWACVSSPASRPLSQQPWERRGCFCLITVQPLYDVSPRTRHRLAKENLVSQAFIHLALACVQSLRMNLRMPPAVNFLPSANLLNPHETVFHTHEGPPHDTSFCKDLWPCFGCRSSSQQSQQCDPNSRSTTHQRQYNAPKHCLTETVWKQSRAQHSKIASAKAK